MSRRLRRTQREMPQREEKFGEGGLKIRGSMSNTGIFNDFMSMSYGIAEF